MLATWPLATPPPSDQPYRVEQVGKIGPMDLILPVFSRLGELLPASLPLGGGVASDLGVAGQPPRDATVASLRCRSQCHSRRRRSRRQGHAHIFGEHPAMSAKVICPCEVRTMEAEADAAKRGTS